MKRFKQFLREEINPSERGDEFGVDDENRVDKTRAMNVPSESPEFYNKVYRETDEDDENIEKKDK